MINKILSKTSVVYSLSSVLKAGIQLLVGFFIARYISKEDFGIWSSLNLIITYSILIQGGVINGLNLELPIALGRRDEHFKNRLLSTSTVYIYFSLFILFVLGIIGYFLYIQSLSYKWRVGYISVTIISIFTIYQDYLTATFRTPESFKRLSKLNFIQSLVNLLTITLIIYYSYYGLVIKSLITMIIYVSLLHIYRPYKVNLRFSKDILLNLLKTGMPIFILAYIQAAAFSFDRVLLIKYFKMEDVGIYSFAYLSFTAITLLSSSLASYIYPTMTYLYAETNDEMKLWSYLKSNVFKIIMALFFLGSIGFFLLPYALEQFFPIYKSSEKCMKILLFAGVFNGSTIGVNVLLSIKKWRLIIIYHLLFSSLLIVLPYTALRYFNESIENVAYAILFANIINFFIAYLLVYFGLFRVNQNDKRTA
ncbi:oligosaccharide flippase family protein [Sphingobacterium luzhongxinii]|uniref:oligosaccharide flippase family protein n=1 Tax=Sphingobacterium luzhongxinii TaxID=2654181 RepID=UPI0013DCA10C|nr:oligosaccharide flippase family protein [Sphingobacterium sp. xlx-73]